MSFSSAKALLSGEKMNSMLSFIRSIRIDLKSELLHQRAIPFIPILEDAEPGQFVGLVTNSFAQKLATEYSNTFSLHSDTSRPGTNVLTLTVPISKSSFEEMTAKVASVTSSLRDQGFIQGWRNELLPLTETFSVKPKLLLERAACPYFGVKAYGVHINGFVRSQAVPGGLTPPISHIWVATRSKLKSTWPGMLDHIVAGAIPYGVSVLENVVKECEEEASIDRSLAVSARPAGAVSYAYLDENQNIRRDALFCFDLELPPDFIPKPLDGEVERFDLREVDWVLERLCNGHYKPNCNLVLVDFFIRHGLISPDSPHYLELVGSLRDQDCA